MRKRSLIFAGLLVLFAVGGAVTVARPGGSPVAVAAAATAVPPGGRSGPPIRYHSGPATAPVGIPAITPRSATADPAKPAFSAQDVETYFRSHGIQGTIGATGANTVEKVEFVTERAVQARWGEGTGPPGSTLLCLVTLRGTYTVSAPPPPHGKITSATSNLLYAVFDAHTGNLLMQVQGPVTSSASR